MPSSTVVIFQLKQLEENVRMKDREYSELTSKKNAILVNHGKLQQEAEVANNSSGFFRILSTIFGATFNIFE